MAHEGLVAGLDCGHRLVTGLVGDLCLNGKPSVSYWSRVGQTCLAAPRNLV